MKRITTSIVTCLICLLFVFQIQAAPNAQLSQSSFDFGIAPQGSKLAHKFWIKSTGTEDLKITKVVPGCGCTKAPLEKDIISSGDSTSLEIIFSSKKYNSKITKRPRFFTNAGEEATYLTFTAQIVPPTEVTAPLVISPFKVDLSIQKVQSNQHLTNVVENKTNDASLGMVQFTNSSDKDLSIKVIDMDAERFKTDIPTIILAGATVSGNISLIDNKTSFQKSVTIEVNDENKTRFTIPVSYNSNIISQK